MKKLGLLSFTLLLLAGCSKIPGMHKYDILQGNVVEEERIANVNVGMSEAEVQHILGTPIIKDSFNEQTWHYVFAHYLSNGEEVEHYYFIVYFDQNKRVINLEEKAYNPLPVNDKKKRKRFIFF